MTVGNTRREFLALVVATTATGLAGCTGSDDSESENTENEEDEASADVSNSDNIEDVEIEGTEITLTLAEDSEISSFQLLSPQGADHDGTSISGAETVATLRLSRPRSETYPTGEYTIVAFEDDEEVEEHTLYIAPELQMTDIETLDYGDGEVLLENTGTSQAYVETGQIVGGHNENNRPVMYPVDEDGYRLSDDDYRIIAPGEEQWFQVDDRPFDYGGYGVEYDEYCTGEGDFEMDVTVNVEDASLGEVSADISVTLTGEVTHGSGQRQSCSEAEVDSLPVELE